MSGPDTDTQWFIARDGKQHGPVSDLELRKLIELSHLKPTDLVWRQGFSDWRTAVSVFPAVAEPAEPATAAPASVKTSPPVTTGRPAASSAPSGSSASSAPSAPAATKPAGPAPGPGPQGPVSSKIRSGPAPAQPSGYAPYAPAPAQPAPDRRPSPGDVRPEPMATRPLGSAPRTGGTYAAPVEPRLTTDGRKPSEMTPPLGLGEPPPRSSRRKLAVAAGLLVMTGLGAWIASRYTDEMLAVVQSGDGSAAEPAVVANVTPPPKEEAAPAADEAGPAAAAAPTAEEVDRNLQARNVWISVKQEFPDWYQVRVAEVARLTAAKKDQTEITRYLIGELVQLRRDNAKHALAASTSRHKELATAFLANLQQLSREGGDGCYDFISKGESSAVIVARMQDPAKSAEIEAQLMAIIGAIVEGRKAPAEHAAPIKTDYDLLAGELGRLGWTQADMQLFANPKALAQAPRDRVCNMLKDWFTAHLAIQDPSSQARLLFETLKPVVSG